MIAFGYGDDGGGLELEDIKDGYAIYHITPTLYRHGTGNREYFEVESYYKIKIDGSEAPIEIDWVD